MQKYIFPSLVVLFLASSILIASNNFFQSSVTLNGDATVFGLITESEYGTPVTNAQISLDKKNYFTSDENGHFEIKSIPAGSYSLYVNAEGYADKEIPFTISAQQQLELNVILTINKLEVEQPEPVSTLDIIVNDEGDYDIATQTIESKNIAPSMSYKYKKSEAADAAIYGLVEDNYSPEFNTEAYDVINENAFKQVIGNPLSTFSIDVDNASYSNIRRFISYGQTPPKDAVRIEEMVNYFDYTYTAPKGNDPFSINYEMSECAWNPESKLVMIGLQGKDIDYSEAAPSNLVFLIDVSGSMADQNKLPLVIKSLNTLVDNLNEHDRVALVVYAGAAGEVLPSTPCNQKSVIKDALNKLQSGGSTAGGAGIKLAYEIATKNLIPNGNNRVILCTDGDFNVGASSDAEMTRLIEEKRKSGVFITLCGFGMGNYKDSKMEKIADNGNGAYYYIDSENEAKKVFTTDMRGTLFTIAKDVKIQIEFNPALVESYRLIGYENRMLNKEDFEDDTKDAGELGAGHRVTALYEIKLRKSTYEPSGINSNTKGEDLKYQTTAIKADAYNTDEIMTLKLRYKAPNSETSKLIEKSLYKTIVPFAATSDNFRFASAVAEFGMILRDSEFKGDATYEEVIKLANSAQGADVNGYRKEFIELTKSLSGLAKK
jgi:Ca-activated chloride channel homolog